MAPTTCFIEGCNRTTVARGLCNNHYYAAKFDGTLEQLAPKVFGPCDQCGEQIPSTRRYGSRFCSVACKEANRAAVQHAEAEARRHGRDCRTCGAPVPPDRGPKAFTCSRQCNDAYQNRKKKELREAGRGPRPTCLDCGGPIPETARWGRVFCSPECKKRTQDARWRKRSPGYMRQYLYGITPAEFDAMLGSQDGCCAICHTDTPFGMGGWHVDHCHDSGHIRGLLCHHCNLMLGNAKDDPARLRAAADYLEREIVG